MLTPLLRPMLRYSDVRLPVGIPAPSVIQSTYGAATASASVTSLPIATTSGNSIIIIGIQQSTFARTLSDNKGNTYTQIGNDVILTQGGYTVKLYAYLCSGVVGGTGHTITASASSSFGSIVVVEVEGKVVVDSTASVVKASPFTLPVNTSSPSLVLCGVQAYDQETHAVDSPFILTQDVSYPSPAQYWPMAVAHNRQAQAGIASVSWPLGSTWQAAMLAVALRKA